LKSMKKQLQICLLIAVMTTMGILSQPGVLQAIDYTAGTTINVGDRSIYPGANFDTIQAAIDDAAYGTRILVYPGTYNENLIISTSITLVSEQGAASTFIQATDSSKHVIEVNATNVKVQGFTLSGATGDKKGGISLREGANHCVITDNVMTGNYAGMGLYKCFSNIITRNTLKNNSYGMGLTEDPDSCAVNQAVAVAYGDGRISASANNISWINDYRQLRDSSLSAGFINDYYTASPEVSKVLLSHPSLAIRACSILRQYSPAVTQAASLASAEGNLVTQDDLSEVISFTNDLCGALQGDYIGRQADRASQVISLLNQFLAECRNIKPGQPFAAILKNSSYYQPEKAAVAETLRKTAGYEDLSSTNYIYLNDFYTNSSDTIYADEWSNHFQSPYEMVYQYNGQTYCSYLGNFYSDYSGYDEGGGGTGNTSYSISGTDDCADYYPLISHYYQYTVAEVTIQPSTLSGRLPLTVKFSASVPAQMGVWYFQWDFEGDGTIDRETSETDTEYTYTQPGKYLPYVAVVRSDWKIISSEPVEIYAVGTNYLQGAAKFQPLYPASETVSSEVMVGGCAHRYYTVLDSNSHPLANTGFNYYFQNDTNELSATTDANGIVDIVTPKIYNNQSLYLCVLDENGQDKQDITAAPAFNVTVSPRKLNQEWSILFGVSGEAGLSGPSASFGPAKFKTAELGLEGGRDTCTKLQYEIAGDSNTVTLLNEENLSLGYKASLGISASLWKGRKLPSIGVGAETEAKINARIGAGGRLVDFMNENAAYHDQQLLAAGVLMLESGVKSMPCMPAGMDGIINYLTNRINPTYCNLLSQDFGTEISDSVGLELTINGSDNSEPIKLPRWDGKLVTSLQTVVDTASSKATRSSHVEMENGFSWPLPNIPIAKDVELGSGGVTLLSFGSGTESMEIENQNGIEKLTLEAGQPASQGIGPFSTTTDTSCKVEVSDPASLAQLKNMRADNQKLLTDFYPDFWPSQFEQMMKDTESLVKPSAYTLTQNTETAFDIPFEIALGWGGKLGVGLQLTGKESLSTDLESGIINNSVRRTTATYEADPELENRKQNLTNFVNTITRPLTEALTGFMDKAVDTAKQGVQIGKAIVRGTADGVNAVVYQLNPFRSTYRVKALPSDYRRQLAAAETPSDLVYEASTVGNVYIVGLQDGATAEDITDFTDRPLQISLSYDDAMLIAAELPTDAENHLGIYRFDGSVGYYIYQAGQLDSDLNMVTATITQPGQYVLAVDDKGPTISDFMVSNHTACPTITATITDDFSGIKTDSLVFYLDEVSIANPASYFDGAGGIFSYPVTQPLASGNHTCRLVVIDTSGNQSDSGSLAFTVNSNPPVVYVLPIIEDLMGHPVVVQASVEDDSAIKSVSLYYKAMGAGSYTIVDMMLVNSLYQGDIPAGEAAGSIQYKVAAVDGDGNITTSTETTVDLQGTQDDLLPAVAGNNIDAQGQLESATDPITVTFNKPVQAGPAFSGIDCQQGAMFYHINGTTLSITPADPLTASQIYTVNIPAGAVQDYNGNIMADSYCLSFSFSGYVDQWDTVYEQEPDKKWTIRFSQPVNFESLSAEDIIVYDADGNRVPIVVVMPGGDGSALMVNSTENYQYGQTYLLYISDKLQSRTGKVLKKPVQMYFVIKNNTNVCAQFVVGSNTCIVNGALRTIDTAPYTENGRTYAGIKDVAKALGVSDANIIWDESNQTVTVLQGDRVSQWRADSNIMLINGAAVTMDVNAERIGSTLAVPAGFVAQALGAECSWDAASQTITFTI